MKRCLLLVLVMAICGAVAASPAVAEPIAESAKKCKKGKNGKKKGKKKGKCKKKKPSAPVPPPKPPDPPPPGPLYISLGDSISVGVGASTPAKSYVSLLFAHYQSTLGVTEVSRRAGAGATSFSLRTSQLPGALADIAGVSDTRAVTIGIGGANVLSGCHFGTSPCAADFATDFSQTLAALQGALAGDPGAETVVAMAYYNPRTGTGTPAEDTFDDDLLGDSKLLDCEDAGDEVGLNDSIAQIADANGVLLANAYPAFDAGGPSFVSGDQIHPTDAGYQALFNAFVGATAPCP
jgi:lysophospholipase L1-like esterase